MTTVTSFTAERMLVIENETIVNAELDGDELVLITREGTDINVGSVRGATGITGDIGPPGAGTSIGQLGQFPKTPLPFGWLLCDGTTKLIATYPDLAAYLGTTFGGNGSTTFGLPGYGGRVLIGFDSSQTEFDTVGEMGGAKTVTLTQAQMPVHSHPHNMSAPDHSHNMAHYHLTAGGANFLTDRVGGPNAGAAASDSIAGARDQTTAWSHLDNTQGASALALVGNIQNSGSGTAHENMPPYRVVLTAIYAGV